jgi:hypothetical protein
VAVSSQYDAPVADVSPTVAKVLDLQSGSAIFSTCFPMFSPVKLRAHRRVERDVQRADHTLPLTTS